MRGNYQRRNAEKSSRGCICNGILTKTWVMRNSAQKFANISRVKPRGWKEGSLEDVSKAPAWAPAEVNMALTASFLIAGGNVPGNITHSAKDTGPDSNSLETLPKRGILNQGKPGDGSGRLRLI